MTPRKRTLGLALLIVLAASFAPAEDIKVYPDGQTPDDRRLQPLKNLDGFFPFDVPGSKAEWEARALRLKRQVQVATGLWPMPERTPLKPVIHGKVERPGFTHAVAQNFTAACSTRSGFGNVVAALSR